MSQLFKEKTTRTVEAEPSKAAEPAALLDQALERAGEKVDSIARMYATALHNAEGSMRRALLLADGIEALRKALNKDIMRRFMAMMNSPLGFKTDRANGGNKPLYDEETVRECLISAFLQGVEPVGNQFNVIAGLCYITKEGYQHKFKTTPGITDLEVSPGTPIAHNGQTCIRVAAQCRFNGELVRLKAADGQPGRVFAIVSHERTGPDAIVGKGTRKALKALWEMVFGSERTPDDGEIEETPAATAAAPAKANGSSADALAEKMGAKQPAES